MFSLTFPVDPSDVWKYYNECSWFIPVIPLPPMLFLSISRGVISLRCRSPWPIPCYRRTPGKFGGVVWKSLLQLRNCILNSMGYASFLKTVKLYTLNKHQLFEHKNNVLDLLTAPSPKVLIKQFLSNAYVNSPNPYSKLF